MLARVWAGADTSGLEDGKRAWRLFGCRGTADCRDLGQLQPPVTTPVRWDKWEELCGARPRGLTDQGNTCPEGASKGRTQRTHGVTSLSTPLSDFPPGLPIGRTHLGSEGMGRAGATGWQQGQHVRKFFLLGCGKQPRLGTLTA